MAVQPGLPESPSTHSHTGHGTVEAAHHLGRAAQEQPSRRSLRAAPAGYASQAVAPPPAVLPASPSPASWEAPGPVLSKGSANLEGAAEAALNGLPAYNKTAPEAPQGLPTLNFLYEADTGNQVRGWSGTLCMWWTLASTSGRASVWGWVDTSNQPWGALHVVASGDAGICVTGDQAS